MSHEKTAVKTIYFSIFSNIALATIKWLGGFFGHSYALIADAIESTTKRRNARNLKYFNTH